MRRLERSLEWQEDSESPVPIPMDLQHASEDFERYLIAARDASGLATRNQTYTMTDGVFRVFRRRLTVKDALRFADVLPPILRAMFVFDWDTEQPQLAFGDRGAMTREAQALRKDHNFAPDSCIGDVARALRKTVDEKEFDRVLASLPDGAAEFWEVNAVSGSP